MTRIAPTSPLVAIAFATRHVFVLEFDGVGESFHLGCFDVAVVDLVVFG